MGSFILCATDLSTSASRGERAAVALARTLGTGLRLVHAEGEKTRELSWSAEARREAHLDRERMQGKVASLSKSHPGLSIEGHVVSGPVREMLAWQLHEADLLGAVVAMPLTHERSVVGGGESLSEALASITPVPLLLVADPLPVETWAQGDGMVLVAAVDHGRATRSALGWVRRLQTAKPCRTVLTHVTSPLAEGLRLGLPPGHEALSAQVLVPRLQAEMRALAAEVAAAPDTQLDVELTDQDIVEALLGVAGREGAGVLVLGRRDKGSLARWFTSSTSAAVIKKFAANVLVVPAGADEGVTPRFRPFSKVLVPMAPHGQTPDALWLARMCLPQGGVVVLLEVLPLDAQRVAQAHERLEARVPPGFAAQGITVRTEVVAGADISTAIAQAAERLDVDVVCLAPRHRPGIAEVVLGSTTREVLQRSSRPVLVVPPLGRSS